MLEDIPLFNPESTKISKTQWQREMYKKVTQDKRDRIFLSYKSSILQKQDSSQQVLPK